MENKNTIQIGFKTIILVLFILGCAIGVLYMEYFSGRVMSDVVRRQIYNQGQQAGFVEALQRVVTTTDRCNIINITVNQDPNNPQPGQQIHIIRANCLSNIIQQNKVELCKMCDEGETNESIRRYDTGTSSQEGILEEKV